MWDIVVELNTNKTDVTKVASPMLPLFSLRRRRVELSDALGCSEREASGGEIETKAPLRVKCILTFVVYNYQMFSE